MSIISQSYLIVYNLSSALVWLYILWVCGMHIISGETEKLWNEVNFVLKVIQTTAILEVFHSLTGIVKTPSLTTFLQVLSRLWNVWAVINVAEDAQRSLWFLAVCTCWALVEVPRYSFYALNILDGVPYFLFWLRYSLFIVLYPAGFAAELGCMYITAKYLMKSKEYIWGQPFKNVSNIQISVIENLELSLHFFIVLVALTFIPGSIKLYGHMARTRAKQFKAYAQKRSGDKSE